MTRIPALALASALALGGCASTSLGPNTGTQAVYAGTGALITAQQTAIALAPYLSKADVATLVHLDHQAYLADKDLLAAAQNGGSTGAEQQAAAGALSALTNFIATKQGH